MAKRLYTTFKVNSSNNPSYSLTENKYGVVVHAAVRKSDGAQLSPFSWCKDYINDVFTYIPQFNSGQAAFGYYPARWPDIPEPSGWVLAFAPATIRNEGYNTYTPIDMRWAYDRLVEGLNQAGAWLYLAGINDNSEARFNPEDNKIIVTPGDFWRTNQFTMSLFICFLRHGWLLPACVDDPNRKFIAFDVLGGERDVYYLVSMAKRKEPKVVANDLLTNNVTVDKTKHIEYKHNYGFNWWFTQQYGVSL